jgi:hypothetical protein
VLPHGTDPHVGIAAAFGLHQVLTTPCCVNFEAAARVAIAPPGAFKDDLGMYHGEGKRADTLWLSQGGWHGTHARAAQDGSKAGTPQHHG